MERWPQFADLRTLIVDDSRAIRLYLEAILSEQGARVAEAASGDQAIRAASEEQFGLILLDLVLPDLDGFEILDRIREHDQDAAIVVITGAGGIESATDALRRGADGYIEKRHLSGLTEDDPTAFLHALAQAIEHRAGVVAQSQLQQLRTEFYSMVTHDLRNPAGSVWGILRLLQSGKAGPLTEKQQQLLDIAGTSAQKLVGLINDYLDYSKIEAGYLKVERAEVDLRDPVGAAVRVAELQAGLRHQTLRAHLPDHPLPTWVDEERIGQVLDNLLSNAIKYTPEGGAVEVEVGEEPPDAAVIRIRDTGMGIPPEQIERLFTAYHRVPGSAVRSIRGTGLGLAIVREIVQAHGGTVHAESAGVPGEGSTFVVRLPTARTPAGAER